MTILVSLQTTTACGGESAATVLFYHLPSPSVTHTHRSISFVFIVLLGLIILPNGCIQKRLRTPCGSSVHTVFWSLLKGYVSHMHQTHSIACCTIVALASMCDHYATTSYRICTFARSLSVIPFDKIYIMRTLAHGQTRRLSFQLW